MKDRQLCLSLVMSLVFICASATVNAQNSKLQVYHLRCEYLQKPLGIDTSEPRLSWKIKSDQRSQKQTHYQILVASSLDKLNNNDGDKWNTGKVTSDRTSQIAYKGKPLASGTQYFWKVRVWGKDNSSTAWSDTSIWSMGLLTNADWKACWISFKDKSPLDATQKKMVLPPARYYRKTFNTDKKINRATVYATALGIYDLHLNGQRVSTQLFTPGWSDYSKRIYYNTFDVTQQVANGQNAIGAIVADGWYSGYVGYGMLVGYGPNRCGRYIYGKTPALLIQLQIEYTDGTTDCIITDPTWKVTTGPYTEADIIMGETYDATKEIPDFDKPACPDNNWANAINARDNGPTKAIFHDKAGQKQVDLGFKAPPVMKSYLAVPITETQTLKPTEITEPKPGIYIFNLGQNFSGVVRLKVKGIKGAKIKIRHGEMLHPDGRLMTENLRKARATDYYIAKGDPKGEIYQPLFTYHGFQFVEISGLTQKPDLDTVTGIVIHSDTPMTSTFECSDPMVNQLFSNITWTQRANFFEVPTDCPQRDERLGWTGDAQIYARTATYNADVAAFFTKWLDDLEESQLPNGAFPDYAPYPMMHGKPNRGFATAWSDAGIICPYAIYKAYGDTRIIERHYDAMQRFMRFRQKQSPDYLGVNTGNGWGDWLSLGSKTPIEFIDTVYFAYSTKLMSEMATAIGKQSDSLAYNTLYLNIKKAFAKKYIKPDGTLTVDNQTGYVLSLSTGLIPDAKIPHAQKRLVQLLEKNDFRMTTGFLGTKPLLAVLTNADQNDLALRLLQSRRFPSWGYEIVNGATSIWERWNSYTKENGFGESGMNSFSHYSFGAVCQWMFQNLAGIDTQGAGFKHIIIHPHPPTPNSKSENEPIHWVRATYDSIHGPITSNWKQTADSFELQVVIPANTTATVYLPDADIKNITESNRPLKNTPGILDINIIENAIKLTIDSGSYNFKLITQ